MIDDCLDDVSRTAAEDDWDLLSVPATKTLYLNGDTKSPIYDGNTIQEVGPLRAHQALQRVVEHVKKPSARHLPEQMSSVHAVTLYVSLLISKNYPTE